MVKEFYELDIKFDSEATDLIKFKKAVAERLKELEPNFPNYTISVESADETQEEAQTWILEVVGLSLTAILLILALTLGSVFTVFSCYAADPTWVLGNLLCILSTRP